MCDIAPSQIRYPHSNTFLQFLLKFEHCKSHKAACHPTIYDIINDIKLFLTVYRRIYGLRHTVTNF